MQFNDGTFWDGKDIENLPILSIEAIAHALSNVCRYGGHTKFHYSVAQHSVVVAKLVENSCPLEGLLHDASEAYIGDIPAPMKHRIPEIKRFEDGIQQQIFKHYNLQWPIPEEVELYDKLILQTEMQNFFDYVSPEIEELLLKVSGGLRFSYEHLNELKTPWPAYVAKQEFIKAYEQYNA